VRFRRSWLEEFIARNSRRTDIGARLSK
jgi:hypothetical protein